MVTLLMFVKLAPVIGNVAVLSPSVSVTPGRTVTMPTTASEGAGPLSSSVALTVWAAQTPRPATMPAVGFR